MRKQLGELRGLDDIPFDIAKRIISQTLHYLWNVKECHVDRVTFKCPHCILNQEGMILVCRKEVCDSCDRIHGGPVEEILYLLAKSVGN